MRKILILAAALLCLTALCGAAAADVFEAKLCAVVTDAGQRIGDVVIDFGDGVTVTGVDAETFTVHASANVNDAIAGTDLASYGDYDLDRTITGVDVDGQKVIIHMNLNEGATLAYTSAARNYPAALTYTVTQNKPFTLTAPDGTVLNDAFTAEYTCDNTFADPETALFEAVEGPDGIDYQFYNPGEGADTLIVWFHGNGEGDMLGSRNNVAQMLANRGTVAWATPEIQAAFGGAYVMSFQAPDTWYYAQRDGLLEKAFSEIQAVIEAYGINPNKVVVSGCSAGGYMSTRMIIAYPTLFKAAIINCPAYDVADARGGETPTDDELKAVKDAGVAIWLVQSDNDTVVATDACSRRLFAILSEGAVVTETDMAQDLPQNSDYTTWETPDGLYRMSLYDTTEDAQLRFAEDYDRDGAVEEVRHSSHWSWIYSLRNNPASSDGTHVIEWAAAILAD